MKLINKCERDYLGMLDLDKLKIRNINYLRNGNITIFLLHMKMKNIFSKNAVVSKTYITS